MQCLQENTELLLQVFKAQANYILEKMVFHVIFAGERLTAVATYQGISLAFVAIAMIEAKNVLILEDKKTTNVGTKP